MMFQRGWENLFLLFIILLENLLRLWWFSQSLCFHLFWFIFLLRRIFCPFFSFLFWHYWYSWNIWTKRYTWNRENLLLLYSFPFLLPLHLSFLFSPLLQPHLLYTISDLNSISLPLTQPIVRPPPLW